MRGRAPKSSKPRLVGLAARRLQLHCSHRSAKTPNPDDPIPNFVRGRESTWLSFVFENDKHASFVELEALGITTEKKDEFR